jgi:arginine decarboxylase
MVAGQVITPAIMEFMGKLDVPEIHGYHPDLGLKLIEPGVRELPQAGFGQEVAGS